MSKKSQTDACISNDLVQTIHRRLTKHGTEGALNRLAERESSLAAYVMLAGHQISEAVRIAGVPDHLADWVNDELIARMLVAIGAQRQAHYDLWRDFMGDEREPAGDSHG